MQWPPPLRTCGWQLSARDLTTWLAGTTAPLGHLQALSPPEVNKIKKYELGMTSSDMQVVHFIRVIWLKKSKEHVVVKIFGSYKSKMHT